MMRLRANRRMLVLGIVLVGCRHANSNLSDDHSDLTEDWQVVTSQLNTDQFGDKVTPSHTLPVDFYIKFRRNEIQFFKGDSKLKPSFRSEKYEPAELLSSHVCLDKRGSVYIANRIDDDLIVSTPIGTVLNVTWDGPLPKGEHFIFHKIREADGSDIAITNGTITFDIEDFYYAQFRNGFDIRNSSIGVAFSGTVIAASYDPANITPNECDEFQFNEEELTLPTSVIRTFPHAGQASVLKVDGLDLQSSKNLDIFKSILAEFKKNSTLTFMDVKVNWSDKSNSNLTIPWRIGEK